MRRLLTVAWRRPFRRWLAPAVVRGAASKSRNPVATFNTDYGSFKAEIFLDRVPRTASNFIDLARRGFYDGLHFHRVIPGFMAQFGCPQSREPHSPLAGIGSPDDGAFENLATGETERRSNGGLLADEHVDETSNGPGTLSMANTGAPDSGGSQFFFNVGDNRRLDWFSPGPSRHVVFGRLLDEAALDVVGAICNVRAEEDRPVQPVEVRSVRVDAALDDVEDDVEDDAAAAAEASSASAAKDGSNPRRRGKPRWDEDAELAFISKMRRGATGDDVDATFASSMGVGGAAPLSANVLESADRRTVVTEVDEGGFELNGDVFVPSSVACLAHSAFLWKARTVDDITVDSMRLFTAVHPRPEIVVLGLGAKGPKPRLVDVERFFRDEGIALEQMDTANAVHTFNILNDEKRTVGAALLTLQPRGADEYSDPFAKLLD